MDWTLGDIDKLGAVLLRPSGRRWEETRALVRGMSSGPEAWRALAAERSLPAGLLFHSMKPSQRQHRYGNCGVPCLCDDAVVSAFPARVFDALLLASDVAGVEEAAALAADGMRRLRPWTRRQPTDLTVWGVSRGRSRVRRVHLNALQWVRIKLLKAMELRHDPTYFGERSVASRRIEGIVASHPDRVIRGGGLIDPLADLWSLGRVWQRVARLGVLVPRGFVEPIEAEGLAFAHLDDPFEPWWQLWTTGYFPWAVGDTGVILGAHAPAQ